MRNYLAWGSAVLVLGHFAFLQQPAGKSQGNEVEHSRSSRPRIQENLNHVLESKIRAAWAAFQKKDRKSYADFLADDFVAVETDNEGARDKKSTRLNSSHLTQSRMPSSA